MLRRENQEQEQQRQKPSLCLGSAAAATTTTATHAHHHPQCGQPVFPLVCPIHPDLLPTSFNATLFYFSLRSSPNTLKFRW